MKKIVTFLLFILISLNIAYANEDFIVQNGVKYISDTKAEEIWGVDIDYFPVSSLIKIKTDNDLNLRVGHLLNNQN